MDQIFTEYGSLLDPDKITFLSDRGSEFVVYKYLESVIKIYKEDYQLTHLSLEDLNFLRNIQTQRILLPTSTLWNANHELIGYMMPFVAGKKNLDNDSLCSFLTELEVLKNDLDLLCSKGIILRDINLSNTIYNGHLYLIDPGNYLIGDLDEIVLQLINVIDPEIAEKLKKIIIEGDYGKLKKLVSSLSLETRQKVLKLWNYNKINELINMLLFSKHPDIDPFKYRQIVQFIKKERENNGFIYILDVLKKYFDSSLSIREAVNDFSRKYIKDNPIERKMFFHK